MKKKLLLTLFITVAFACVLAFSVSATVPTPTKPTLDVSFGETQTIEGFTPPSQLYVETDERVLLTDGNGAYVTYPTYYITKDSATFDVDFTALNNAQSIQYTKASIAMLEIPDGITTVTASYFAGSTNFANCVSVQFPGTVTSYGSTLFGNYNSVIRVVEFLDGTEPITMGDQMFGSKHDGGTTNLQYVKFPNNLTSIGNNTFGKSFSSKTVIFGENLESIGTGFFGESTPSSTDTFLYISNKFFTETEMFTNLFGSEAPYHNNHLRLIIFYTGTQEEAQALIDKGAAVQTGYVFNNATLVSTSEYDYATHKPTVNKSATIVYGYNVCDAFYNSVHDETEPYYEFAEGKYISALNECVSCTNCGKKIETQVGDALFTSRGYSKDETSGSIMYDILVNYEAMDFYTEKTGATVAFGLAVSGNLTLTSLINEDETIASSDVLKIKFDGTSYTKLQIKILNIGTSADAKVHACAYVIENKEDVKTVSYIGNGTTASTATPVSYAEISSTPTTSTEGTDNTDNAQE